MGDLGGGDYVCSPPSPTRTNSTHTPPPTPHAPHPDVVLGCDRAPSRKRGCARVNVPAFGWNGCPPSDLPIQIPISQSRSRSPNPDPISLRRSPPDHGHQGHVQRPLRVTLSSPHHIRRASANGKARRFVALLNPSCRSSRWEIQKDFAQGCAPEEVCA